MEILFFGALAKSPKPAIARECQEGQEFFLAERGAGRLVEQDLSAQWNALASSSLGCYSLFRIAKPLWSYFQRPKENYPVLLKNKY